MQNTCEVASSPFSIMVLGFRYSLYTLHTAFPVHIIAFRYLHATNESKLKLRLNCWNHEKLNYAASIRFSIQFESPQYLCYLRRLEGAKYQQGCRSSGWWLCSFPEHWPRTIFADCRCLKTYSGALAKVRRSMNLLKLNKLHTANVLFMPVVWSLNHSGRKPCIHCNFFWSWKWKEAFWIAGFFFLSGEMKWWVLLGSPRSSSGQQQIAGEQLSHF